MEKEEILGSKPPKRVREKFNLWSRDVKKRSTWKLDGIAESVFVIAHHAHNHQEKLREEKGCHASSTNSKIIALVLMYSHFISIINLAEANRRSQNKAAAAKILQQQTKSDSTKPLPPDFRYDASKVCIYVSLCAITTDYFHSLILSYRMLMTTSRMLIFLVPRANTTAQ